jgi:hypothetical protein
MILLKWRVKKNWCMNLWSGLICHKTGTSDWVSWTWEWKFRFIMDGKCLEVANNMQFYSGIKQRATCNLSAISSCEAHRRGMTLTPPCNCNLYCVYPFRFPMLAERFDVVIVRTSATKGIISFATWGKYFSWRSPCLALMRTVSCRLILPCVCLTAEENSPKGCCCLGLVGYSLLRTDDGMQRLFRLFHCFS